MTASVLLDGEPLTREKAVELVSDKVPLMRRPGEDGLDVHEQLAARQHPSIVDLPEFDVAERLPEDVARALLEHLRMWAGPGRLRDVQTLELVIT